MVLPQLWNILLLTLKLFQALFLLDGMADMAKLFVPSNSHKSLIVTFSS
jgi:hypothetical protein